MVSVAVWKMGVFLHQAWSKSQWTVLMGYLTISTNVRCYQTHHRWQFFFQEDSAQVHCSCNTVQLSEICDFRVSPFCQVVQKHKSFQVAQWSVFSLPTLLVTFLRNMSNSIHVCQSYSKPKAGRFLRHGVYIRKHIAGKHKTEVQYITKYPTFQVAYALGKLSTASISHTVHDELHYSKYIGYRNI